MFNRDETRKTLTLVEFLVWGLLYKTESTIYSLRVRQVLC